MRLIYNILFSIGFVFSAPYYFLKMWRRGNWKAGFGQRFAMYTPEFKARLSAKPVLWLHAVSVGEVGICLQFIKLLAPRYPQYQIVVSTTTSTGMGELRSKLPETIEKIYYPIDSWWGVRNALNTIRPSAILLIEAEFWPNLLWQAIGKNIPLFLVNARVSDRSYRGYKRAAFIFRPIFAKFRAAGCQNKIDADRLLDLGFPADSVHQVGNLKFDAAKPDGRPGLDVPALLRQIGVPDKSQLLVCGSTHNGEEAILGTMCLRLREKFPNLFLILVPRHFERAKDVSVDLQRCGVKFMLRTEIKPGTQVPPGQLHCLVVNSTGELKYFYQHATLVFVGKSLTAEGGQNPIEPGALGKAMVLGPNMQNFVSVTKAFLAAKGAIQVHDADELELAFTSLLANESERQKLGQNAQKVVQEATGATARTVDFIGKSLL